jgi:vitamin-K-epoxide reductase (warfarin-sensitive)
MRYVIATLAVVGIIVSSLALHVHYSQDVEVCDINAHWDCGIVNHSRYAEIGHIPVAVIGIAGYAVLALLALLRRNQLLAVLSILALAFSLYLTHIEAKVLQIWCLYCVISQTLIAVIALLSIIGAVRQRARAMSAPA